MSRRDAIAAKIAARSHYEDRGYKDPETGLPSLCRIWDGPKSGDPDKTRGHGYGRMNLDAGTVAVHIAAWVNENGLIPPRKQLDHLCHQRDCCEERHLRLKTHKQNQRNKKPKTGVHGEIGPEGVRGTSLKFVDLDLGRIERRVIAAMFDDGGPPMSHLDYGGTMTGRMSLGPVPQYFKPTDPPAAPYEGVAKTIIDHDIPADRLPPAAAEVQDE